MTTHSSSALTLQSDVIFLITIEKHETTHNWRGSYGSHLDVPSEIFWCIVGTNIYINMVANIENLTVPVSKYTQKTWYILMRDIIYFTFPITHDWYIVNSAAIDSRLWTGLKEAERRKKTTMVLR